MAKKPHPFYKPLPQIIFLLSMLLVLLVGLALIATLYFLVNPAKKVDYLQGGNPVTNEPTSLTLNLSSPDDNVLVFSPNLLIQGKTLENALVLISSNSDRMISANNKGDFSFTWNLDEGVNNLTIVAFDTAGNSKTTTRTVYYSKEKI